MSYRLSNKSQSKLYGLHPYLVQMVEEAIRITKQDFTVFEGVRSLETQKMYLSRGVTKTMNSYHLYGLAVDLVPYINGAIMFECRQKNLTRQEKNKITREWYGGIEDACKNIIAKYHLPIEWGYDKWGWDMPHWQVTKINGIDSRRIYDIRKGGYIV